MATTKRSLTKKLTEILKGIEWIPKNGWNDFHKYKFVREADILDALRKELSAAGIFLYASVTNREIERQSDGKTWSAIVDMVFTFVDADTDEKWQVFGTGHSMDKGDKAIYKAMTGATKYMLLKNFLVSSGEDPENHNDAGDGKPSGKSKAGKPPKSGKTDAPAKGEVTGTAIEGPFPVYEKDEDGNDTDKVKYQGGIIKTTDGEEKKVWMTGAPICAAFTDAVGLATDLTFTLDKRKVVAVK